MSRTWDDLQYELDCWIRRGLKARFWVRDDDACEMSSSLARLHDLASRFDITVGLAMIPSKIRPGLLEFLTHEGHRFHPMCHGWQHINYAPAGHKPSEFGNDRPISAVVEDAKSALSTFRNFFADSDVVFVPPFGQISRAMIKALPGIGFVGMSGGPGWLERKLLHLSFFGIRIPRVNVEIRSRIPRLDVQIDPIDWQKRTAHSADTICEIIVRCLRLRRLGFLPSGMPVGLVTHHLDHDDKVWDVCNDVLDFLTHHHAVEFVHARQFFATIRRAE
jgi:hypothetical protein